MSRTFKDYNPHESRKRRETWRRPQNDFDCSGLLGYYTGDDEFMTEPVDKNYKRAKEVMERA